MNVTAYFLNGSTTELQNGTSPTTITTYDRIAAYLTLCQVANACFVVATIWIILNLMLYLMKHRRRKNVVVANRLDGRKMYAVCLSSVILALPRLVMSQVMFYLPHFPDALQNCEILMDVWNVLYLIAVASSYGFLWFRQRTIYGLPMIREITGKLANIISWVLVLVMLSSYVTLFCVFSIPAIYSWNSKGCTLKRNQTKHDMKARATRYYIITAVMIVWQIALVSLFVYPMILIKRSQFSIRTRKKSGGIKDSVKKAIRRSIICASVAAISDITTVTLAAFIPLDYPVFMATTLYDVTLQINIFCIIATFGENVGILNVCYIRSTRSNSRKRRKRKRRPKMDMEYPID